MSQEVAVSNRVSAELQEKVLLGGDLSGLTPAERLVYLNAVCESLDINPLTRPFEYIELDHKLVLYARKDCTDQLRARKERPISVEIVKREIIADLIVVTAQATAADGRKDESVGAVPSVKEDGEWRQAQSGKRYFAGKGTYVPLSPLERANAMMKAETKAKRRVTLSICGLGMLDEIELEDVVEQKTVSAVYANKRDAATKIGQIMVEGLNVEPQQEDGAGPRAEPGSSLVGDDHQQSSDAPASNELGQLMDYQAALEGCSEHEQAQTVWDQIVKDATVTSDNRKSLYQTYQKTLNRMKPKRGQGARG